jgi:L-fucose isomerase-like protein
MEPSGDKEFEACHGKNVEGVRMLYQQITIGLAPCRRWRNAPRTPLFNPEVAQAIKKDLVSYIRRQYESADVKFVDIDFLNAEGLMSAVSEAAPIAGHFLKNRVDAVFIINCNFGDEEVAGKVAKLVGKPVLLWGPQDKLEPDGFRHTDTQCGLFSIGKQFIRLGVKFSYIENCHITDPVFDQDFRRFISVVRMIKNFSTMRVAQIGNRPKPFYSVIYNEGELLERFGIEVVPVNAAQAQADLQAIYKQTTKKADAIAELKSKFEIEGLDDDMLWRIAAFKQFYRDVAANNDCRVIATECVSAMQLAIDALPCTAMSLLAEEGLIIACEADVLGAVAMGILGAAAGKGDAPFLGEFTIRHPSDKNTELLWHCGALPYCLKKNDCTARLIASHPGRDWLQLREGTYTTCRLDGAGGRYSMLVGTCQGVDGPYTYGAYLWAKFNDLGKWERRLVEGPYIHHLAEISGDYTNELKEFCRYYPEIALDMP